jgi:phosphoglycerol transferase MdoB-like AlkP superfamily enzyme
MNRKFKDFDPSPVVYVVTLIFGPGLLFYFMARIWFFIVNFSTLNQINYFSAFFHGLRFDLSLLATLHSLLLIFAIGWSFFRKSTKFLTHLFIAIQLPFLWVELADSAYFKFTGRRSTISVIQFFDDAKDQALHLASSFIFVPIGLLVFSVLFVKFTFWISKRNFSYDFKYPSFFVFLAVLCFAVLARGGIQEKPLTPAHAFGLQGPSWAALSLNTGFNILRSKSTRLLSRSGMEVSEVRSVLDQFRSPTLRQEVRSDNIVVIIVESLGLESMQQPTDVTPFLNSLKDKSLFFDNGFANGRRSIEAVPSILGALPALMAEPFINTEYRANRMKGLPRILTSKGYDTWFFHGGRNGTMFFDVMTAMFGVGNYFGKSEYGWEDHDGAWGIYDGPFLSRVIEKLSNIDKPFFSTIFTLSSHNPYKIPEDFKDKADRFSSPFYKSLHYTDQSLKVFFENAAKQEWFDNTLFIITGDHTADSQNPKFQQDLGLYRVPVIVYSPSGSVKPKISHAIVQHADFSSSILDYLGLLESDSSPTLIGRSMFNEDIEGYVVIKSGEVLTLGLGNRIYSIFPSGSTESKALDPEFYLGLRPSNKDAWQVIRAIEKYFEFAMNEDKLDPSEWKVVNAHR